MQVTVLVRSNNVMATFSCVGDKEPKIVQQKQNISSRTVSKIRLGFTTKRQSFLRPDYREFSPPMKLMGTTLQVSECALFLINANNCSIVVTW